MATPFTPTVGPAEVDRAWQYVVTLDSIVSGNRGNLGLIEAEMATGGVIARAGMPDSADVVLRRARGRVTPQNDPGSDMLAVEAYMRTLGGDYDEAVDLLKLYVLANPDHGFEEHAGTQWLWQKLRQESPRWSEITGGR